MKLSIISFTENGKRLSEYIANAVCEKRHGNEKDTLCKPKWTKVVLYTKCKNCAGEGYDGQSAAAEVRFVETSLSEWAKNRMQENSAILFIGACGIAVRAVAPHLTDKLRDSPVLVMDERGEYVIPILSGHVGGANEIARYLSKLTGAAPVITTATDLHDKFAVDLFAKENNLFIINKEGIAKVSSKVLAGEEITVSVEPGYESGLKWESEHKDQEGIASLDYALIQGESLAIDHIPQEIRQVSYPPEQYVDIVITTNTEAFDAAIILQPREYVIGIGCRKGKSADELGRFIMRKLSECGVLISQVIALASISIKSDEPGIVRWCRKENIPFVTYMAEELQAVEGDFAKSSFVQEQVGVDNVCERAALRACGGNGQLICAKCAENGMTFALVKCRRGRNLS